MTSSSLYLLCEEFGEHMGKLALNFYFYAHLSRRKNNFQMAQLHYFIDIQIAVRKVYKYRFVMCTLSCALFNWDSSTFLRLSDMFPA